jgi:hypothetical protein
MERIKSRLSVVQNLGLVDRMMRVFIGTALLAGGIVSMFSNATLTWEPYAMLISIYPLLTCILGWDPVYASFGARTCSLEGGRNACGTFPFEVDAAVAGNKLVPDTDYDHSLYGSHHEPERKQAA